MTSIIKRKKQDKFFIMSNHAAQENLTSLSSIGLLAYIKSLPEDFILYKTFLQKKFTRRTVDSAWAELVEKKYIAGFSCYVDRKKRYFYLANDEPLTQQDFIEFTEDTISELAKEGLIPKNLQVIKDCNFSIVQNVQHLENTDKPGNVQNVQYNKYSTASTVSNGQIQINTNKEIQQINTNKEISSVNTNDQYKSVINSLFLKYGDGLFNKDDIIYFTDKIIDETETKPNDPEAYFYSIIDMIITKRKMKLGIYKPKFNGYNWLEA